MTCCQDYWPIEEDSEFLQNMKEDMRENLKKRYTEDDVKLFLHVASLFDPRFKMLTFVTGEEKAAACAELKRLVTSYGEKNKEKVIVKSEIPEEPKLPALESQPGSSTEDVVSESVHSPVSKGQSYQQRMISWEHSLEI